MKLLSIKNIHLFYRKEDIILEPSMYLVRKIHLLGYIIHIFLSILEVKVD